MRQKEGDNMMRQRTGKIQTEIRRMVKRLARMFRPEQIILFGSYARGDAGPDSDVDLLVVMPVAGSKLEKEIELRAALPDFSIPIDVIISRPQDFAWRKNYIGTIEHPALREGKVLYSAR